MPISDNAPRNAYIATSGQTAFTYAFEIVAQTDLVVMQEGVTLALTTDYTVSGVGDTNGGTVTLVTGATVGDEVVIYRDMPINRTTDYQPGARLNPDTLDADLDRVVLGVQQIERDVSRALHLAPEDVTEGEDFTIPSVAARAGMYAAYGPTGLPIAASGTGTDAALRADLASTAAGMGAELIAKLYVGSVTELRNLPRPTTDGFPVYLTNYYADIPGGDGPIMWDDDNTDDDNGGTVFLRTGQDSGTAGRWVALGEMNAKRWGAKGDGSTDDTTRLQAAIDAGGEIIFPAGQYVASGLTVSGTAVSFVGQTPNTTRLRFTNTTGTLFTITGALFRLSGFEFESPSATHTAGAVFDIQASQGQVRNVRFNGAFWDIFKMESNAGDGWHFDMIRVSGGWTNNSLFRLKATTSTVASTHINNLISATNSTWTEAAIILDTGVDTFQMTGGEFCGTGKLLHIKDSVPGQDPRYIHFDGVSMENTTDDMITIDAGDDIRFSDGYFATGRNIFVINAGRDIAIEGNHFVSLQRSALDLNGGSRVRFVGNKVLDASQETDVTYSSIDIAANVSEWEVRDNTFRLRSGTTNKPLRQLTIASGTSTKFRYGGNDWGVAGTDFGAAGAPAVSDDSAGTNIVITDNVQSALYRGGGAVSNTGSTTENDLVSVTVPAGALRARDGARIVASGTSAGTNGTKTIRAYFGSLVVGSVVIPAASTDSWYITADIFNNSQTAQTYGSLTTRTPFDTEGTVVRNKSGSGTVDTTAAVTLKITGQLANSADTIVLRTFANEVIRR